MIRTPALLKSENHSMVVSLWLFPFFALSALRIADSGEVLGLGSSPFALIPLKLDDMKAHYISSNKVFEVTKHLSLGRPMMGE
jgi:hypothetical protein